MSARLEKAFLRKSDELFTLAEAIARQRGALVDPKTGRPYVDIVKTCTVNSWAVGFWEPDGTDIKSPEYAAELRRILRRKAVLSPKRAAGARVEQIETFGLPITYEWPEDHGGVPVTLWISVEGWPEPKIDYRT